ncbi:MAG: FecR family protein [Mangrovibacterium sp.]
MEKSDPGYLFIKSFNGTINKEEEQFLRSWLEESEENRKEYQVGRELWDHSKSLVLSVSINTERALQKTKRRIPHFDIRFRWLTFARQAAAVLLLSVLFTAITHYFMSRKPAAPDQVVFQEVKAAYGTQTRVLLSDGTSVWLNSGSTIRFPMSFGEMENRAVDLKGEGYFEVTRNSEKPFIISTSHLQVKVLGTSFNVNAYEGEKHVEIALLEGKVELLKKTLEGVAPVLTLNPSEVADFNILNNQMIHKTDSDIDRYTAWKDGKIVFFDDPVEKLVSRLENWYNVDIQIADERLKRYHFTATFGQESLDQVLKYLTISTPFQYRFVAPDTAGGRSVSRTKVILY